MAFVDDLFLAFKARPSIFSRFEDILPASLPRRLELCQWVLSCRIIDSCSSLWNRGIHKFPIIMQARQSGLV